MVETIWIDKNTINDTIDILEDLIGHYIQEHNIGNGHEDDIIVKAKLLIDFYHHKLEY